MVWGRIGRSSKTNKDREAGDEGEEEEDMSDEDNGKSIHQSAAQNLHFHFCMKPLNPVQ